MPCEVMKNASFVAFEQMPKLMNNKIISFLINILHEHHLSISKDPDVIIIIITTILFIQTFSPSV